MAGRPTVFKEEYNEQAYKLCLLGATDAEMADFFGCAESSINLWKTKYPEFSESIKKGKIIADSEVGNSLYERAKGCTVKTQQAIKLTTKTPDENGKITQTEEIEIVDLEIGFPPDTTAAIFWLKNRKHNKWRDKQEHEHSVPLGITVNYQNQTGNEPLPNDDD